MKTGWEKYRRGNETRRAEEKERKKSDFGTRAKEEKSREKERAEKRNQGKERGKTNVADYGNKERRGGAGTGADP